ncbi:MAG: patatin-like phospholipase family protein [Verrucomicrobiota bacterium]|nr:patatin-like phospholipase family protein [Verrucomicrobiota bacterium]
MKRILCIDGGGMRGLIPAVVLAELERKAKKPCHEIFDLISGTSIGGILAALLSSGVPASETIQFFTEDGPRIFHRRLWRSFGWLAPRYPAGPLEAVLKKKLGGARLSNCKTKIVVPALNVATQAPVFFNNFEGSPDYFLWQIARGSSAAQTYFPAFRLDGMILWDGGNEANNPSACAAADAFRQWGDEPLQMLSLGCGESLAKITPKKLINPGLIRAGLASVALLFEASSNDADYQMKQSLGANYFRIQPGLKTPLSLDDASPQGIIRLREAAQNCAREYDGDIDRFLRGLSLA